MRKYIFNLSQVVLECKALILERQASEAKKQDGAPCVEPDHPDERGKNQLACSSHEVLQVGNGILKQSHPGCWTHGLR